MQDWTTKNNIGLYQGVGCPHVEHTDNQGVPTPFEDLKWDLFHTELVKIYIYIHDAQLF